MVSFRTRTGRLFDTWSAFIILFLISTTSAHHQNLTAGVQVHNHTTPLGTMTFAKEPGGRGTWSIIFSCTATFAFCVWTAVHPDTISGLSTRRRILYRTILMVIAAINPEAIAVLSYRQWRSARKIKTDWKKHFDALQHPRKHEISAEELEVWQTKKDKWCGELKMTAAFFVVMGGFVIDKSKATSNERSKDKYQGKFARFKKPAAATGNPGHFIATLTPRGFLEYLKEGYFNDFENPPFKTYEIMDKNKEDCFGKILASLQTLWLLVQSIQRYRSNLTITLLEVHVLIQVACTALIFLCWLSKPMDVNEPIQIALKLPKSDQRQPGSQQATDNDAIFRSRTNMPSQTESAERYELLQPFYNHTEGKHLTTEELLWKEACDISCNLLPLDHYYTTSRAPLNRSGVVNRAFYDIIVNITRTDQATKGQCKRRPRGGGETSKSDDRTGLSGVGGVGMMFAEGFFIIVIAGLHALAWNFTFPTPLERLLWRLSCVGMAVFPMAVIVCAAKNSYHIDLVKVLWNHSTVGCHGWDYLPQSLVYLCEIAEVSALPGYRHPSTSSCLTTTTQETKSMDAEAQITTEKPVGGGASWGKILLHICLLTLCILLLAGYLVSILFITVEGYISLRTLPDSAFMTPRWTDYWPHV